MRGIKYCVVLLALAAPLLCCQAVDRRRPSPSPSPSAQCPTCSDENPDTAPAPGDFAFYFLVRQWPNEFCFKNQGCFNIPRPDAGFTLHGLWPNLDNYCQQDYPEHCSLQDGFDKFNLGDINAQTLAAMDTEWPSYTTKNPCFWEHEWDCHGSCSGFSQQDYFQKTLNLHKRYDIPAALAAKSIQPSETPVSRSDFLDALEADFGVRPLLYCQGGGGKDYINEIFMCFTQDLKAVNCDQVCRTQPCEPRGAQQCNEELIYKLGPVASKAERPCSNNFRQCHEKSGTCQRGNQLGLNMNA